MGSWAAPYREALLRGETVRFRPRGGSMRPRVESGQLCTVAPVAYPLAEGVAAGDVVLCRVGGSDYLHLVLKTRKSEYLIGNARGRPNGWVGPGAVYGKLVAVGE